jgi:hypothetical protein
MSAEDWGRYGDIRFVIDKIITRRPLLQAMKGEAAEEEIEKHEKVVKTAFPKEYRVFLMYFGNLNADRIQRNHEKDFYNYDYSIHALSKEYAKNRRGRTDLRLIKEPSKPSLILIGIRPFGEEVNHLYMNVTDPAKPVLARICNCGEQCREDMGIDLREFVARYT